MEFGVIGMKKLNIRNLLILISVVSACCVLVLTVMAVGLKESGVKPEETAISANLVIKTYFYNDEYSDEIEVNINDKTGIENLRKLEESVKNLKLESYMASVVWDATFTYYLEDGTKEERLYTKSDVNKEVDAFLDKYYKQNEE